MTIIELARTIFSATPVSLLDYYDELLTGAEIDVYNESIGEWQSGRIEFVDASPYANEADTLRAYWVETHQRATNWLKIEDVCELLEVR